MRDRLEITINIVIGNRSAERPSFAPEDGRGGDIEDMPKRDTAQPELAATLSRSFRRSGFVISLMTFLGQLASPIFLANCHCVMHNIDLA